MKNIKYVLVAILVLGTLGAIFKPKKKSENNIKTEKVNIETKKDKLVKKSIDLDNSEFWNEFDPMVKIRVYKMIEEKNCSGLQAEFNITADNMDRLQSSGKSASRNIDLMDFLTKQMRELNCY